jgi:hypothetical protein
MTTHPILRFQQRRGEEFEEAHIFSAFIEQVRFAVDSPLEGSGFELSVPLGRATASNRLSSVREHRDPMASPAAKASRLTEVPRQDKSGYG